MRLGDRGGSGATVGDGRGAGVVHELSGNGIGRRRDENGSISRDEGNAYGTLCSEASVLAGFQVSDLCASVSRCSCCFTAAQRTVLALYDVFFLLLGPDWSYMLQSV